VGTATVESRTVTGYWPVSSPRLWRSLIVSLTFSAPVADLLEFRPLGRLKALGLPVFRHDCKDEHGRVLRSMRASQLARFRRRHPIESACWELQASQGR
jgi:hypothetical protein